VAVDTTTAKIRQGSLLPALVTQGTRAGALVDFTTFTGGIVFKMVCHHRDGTTTTVTGPATSDASGSLSYQWQPGNTDVAGTYSATFTGIDGGARPETFPTAYDLVVVVFPAI
jgi:hypothetical protein